MLLLVTPEQIPSSNISIVRSRVRYHVNISGSRLKTAVDPANESTEA
jgi:hypothetical protein